MTFYEKPKILIVEDDFENQKYLNILLRKEFEPDVTDNADEAYSLLQKKNYNIILMDISLQGKKDGLQFTRELKADPLFKTIPVVALSAHAFPKDKDNAINAGVELFFTKPVDGSLLVENLLRIVNSLNKRD